MKELKKLKDGIALKGLTWKQKAIVWWFAIALCLLGMTEEAPIWFVLVEVANVAIPGMMLKNIPIPESLTEDESMDD